MNAETIILKDLSIGYRTKNATRVVAAGINAAICRGELTCLLGANGVGKSTLLRTLSAFQPALSGEVLIASDGNASDADISLTSHLSPLKRLFPFSFKIMVSAIFTQVNNQIMNLLLGRYYGETNTGHYNQAYQWSSKGFLLVGNMVKQVDQTVLVGLHDERERQLMVLRKMMRFTAFIAFPLLFGLGLVSHEFIVLAIKAKWAFAASLLPYLCLCGAFMPLSTLLTDAIISHQRSDIYLWSTMALGILQIALMVALWPKGIYTMVIAYTALNIIWVFVWHFFTRRLMGYRLLSFLKDILPFALAAAGVMVVTGVVTEFIVDSLEFIDDYLKLWVLLISRIVIAAVLYYGVMRISGAVILKECIAFIMKKKSA